MLLFKQIFRVGDNGTVRSVLDLSPLVNQFGRMKMRRFLTFAITVLTVLPLVSVSASWQQTSDDQRPPMQCYLVGEQHVALNRVAQSAAVVRTRRLAVIPVNFDDDMSQPFTIAEIENAVFNASNPESVVSRFNKSSYGQFVITGQVFPWTTLNPQLDPQTGRPWTGCERATTLAASARSAAGAAGFDHYMYIFPKNTYTCSLSGAGELNGTNTWLLGNIQTKVMFHELGHNIGWMHASYYPCPGSPYIGDCNIEELGDTATPMGTGFNDIHAVHKIQSGWIDPGDTTLVDRTTGKTVVTLYPVEESSGKRDIRIPLNDGTQFSYHVEYRSDAEMFGLLVRLVNHAPGSYNTYLIPGGYGNPLIPKEAPLKQSGQAYRDPDRGITITVLAIDQSSATVEVSGQAFDQNAVRINSVTLGGVKKVTIKGTNFGVHSRVLINGIDKTSLVTTSSNTTIKMKGKAALYGFVTGRNTFHVVSGDGTKSTIYIVER